ncbi:MAG: polymorphic toxin-type HINT domain-containing protein [Pirellulales bacterium]
MCALSGETADKTPREWWDWWAERTGVTIPNAKETRYVHLTNRILDRFPAFPDADAFAPRPNVGGFVPNDGSISGRLMSHDCFVAGTPVWTEFGAAAIETLRPGDRVLAVDSRTGARTWKSVLRSTVRPPEALHRIVAGDDSLRCTAGHPFLVVGRGWTTARDLRPGMMLETLNGPVEVELSERDSRLAATFNLVVEDAHNYYAGKSRLLTHDNTRVRETPKPRLIVEKDAG